jgi:hypothetical protein
MVGASTSLSAFRPRPIAADIVVLVLIRPPVCAPELLLAPGFVLVERYSSRDVVISWLESPVGIVPAIRPSDLATAHAYEAE